MHLHMPEDAYRSGCGSGRLRILTPALPDVPQMVFTQGMYGAFRCAYIVMIP